MKKLLIVSLMAIAIQNQAQNVGIGTPTPNAKLEVVGSGNTSASNTFLLKNSSATNLLRMHDNGQLFVGEPTVADIRQYKFRVESADKGSLFIENPITNFNATVRILRGVPESDVYESAALNVKASSDFAGVFTGRGGIRSFSGHPNLAGGMFIGNTVQTPGGALFTGDGIALELVGGIKISTAVNKPIFTHVTTAANNDVSTTKLTYHNPLATDFLIVTPNYEAGPVANAHNISVYFDGTLWRIWNQDSAAMPVGTAFNVMVIRQ